MLEIDINLTTILLAIIGVILIPVITHFYRSDIQKTKDITMIKGELLYLREKARDGEDSHEKLEDKVDDIYHRVVRTETLLSKGESK